MEGWSSGREPRGLLSLGAPTGKDTGSPRLGPGLNSRYSLVSACGGQVMGLLSIPHCVRAGSYEKCPRMLSPYSLSAVSLGTLTKTLPV